MTSSPGPGRAGERGIRASAPGKINPFLAVGPKRRDGYHELTTLFQATSLRETVGIRMGAESDTLDFSGPVDTTGLSRNADNLVWRAVEAVWEACAGGRTDDGTVGSTERMPVTVTVEKHVPIAGGMGGGSADAAAALIAYHAWLLSGCETDVRAEAPCDAVNLRALARTLGADVPFAMEGGTAEGRGRGDHLERVEAPGFSWVLAFPGVQLSTPAVFTRLDAMREAGDAALRDPGMAEEGLSRAVAACRSGDPGALAECLHNDLEAPATSLSRDLSALLDVCRSTGALRVLVSGSGPTVALLARGPDHADHVVGSLKMRGVDAVSVRAGGRDCPGAAIV